MTEQANAPAGKAGATARSTIQRSATIGVEDTTMPNLAAAQATVGAPDTARVTTGGYYNPAQDSNSDFPYSVTFYWVE